MNYAVKFEIILVLFYNLLYGFHENIKRFSKNIITVIVFFLEDTYIIFKLLLLIPILYTHIYIYTIIHFILFRYKYNTV